MNKKEIEFDILATVVTDEVCTYLKNTRCVNKLEPRTQLALRVLNLIAEFQTKALNLLSDPDCDEEFTDEDKKHISNKANELRERVYNSLKEY